MWDSTQRGENFNHESREFSLIFKKDSRRLARLAVYFQGGQNDYKFTW